MKFPTQISWIIVALCLTFVFGLTLIGNDLATRIENYVGVSISIGCFVRYRRDALRALLEVKPTNVQVLCLGIFLAWLGNIIRNFYSSIERDFGLGWIRWGPFVPLFLFLMILSGIFHMVGPNIKDGKIDKAAVMVVGRYVLVGIIAALIVTIII